MPPVEPGGSAKPVEWRYLAVFAPAAAVVAALRVLVVYVLEESDDELLVLDAGEHAIRYLATADIADRVPCNEVTRRNRVPGRTLSWYLGSVVDLPRATSPRCR